MSPNIKSDEIKLPYGKTNLNINRALTKPYTVYNILFSFQSHSNLLPSDHV